MPREVSKASTNYGVESDIAFRSINLKPGNTTRLSSKIFFFYSNKLITNGGKFIEAE